VAYIAGAPPVVAPPPSFANSASTTTLSTIREHPLPPPPSLATDSLAPSTISLAHATIGDHDSNSRRVSMLSQQPSMVLGTTTTTVVEELLPKCVASTLSLSSLSCLTLTKFDSSHVQEQVPTYPMSYTFTPVEGDSETMILVPSTNTSSSHAIYHIKVTHDLFDPSFFITTIRKGGSSNGRLIGDFT
jgi:hypothetical protein